MSKKYLDWAKAGGSDECEHGYAKGIPCPTCDREKEVPTMPHKPSEPLSEWELAAIWARYKNGQAAHVYDITRLIATVRYWQYRAVALQETLDGTVDIVLKEAEHD